MTQEPNDSLDRLLAQSPPPPAPPWFEQRLMARMRREREASVWQRMLAWRGFRPSLTLASAVSLVLVGIFTWQSVGPQHPSSTPLAHEEILQGLDAFAAYTEQSRTWNIEW